MSDDLPDQFDLVVLGTGFTESCIAAAASRIGKSVLHIDSNEYYGDVWSSFSLDALCKTLQQGTNALLRNSRYTWHAPENSSMEENSETAAPNNESWTRDGLLAKSRRFNIDLCPRILYATGDLVKLLIKSNICRYAEFRAVDHVCMRYNDEIVSVPCSRSDVFNTKTLSIVEKRLLMKFLTTCKDYGEDKCNEDSLTFRGKTFQEYLQAQRVTDKIASCVMQAIAMCKPDSSFEEGMQRTQRFLGSLGCYGNTPFLFPMYGCGELPQCFCRLCAVYGGIYCLKRSVDSVRTRIETNDLELISDGKTIQSKHLVCSPGHLPEQLIQQYGQLNAHVSRGIFIANTPVGSEELNKGGGGVNFLRLVSDNGAREAIFIQLSHHSGTCPEGLYIYHLTTPAVSDDPAADLYAFTEQLFSSSAPQILFSTYFTLMDRSFSRTSADNSPIYTTAAPGYELDYNAAIANACDIFKNLYGELAEFLPRAPDPEEIVIDGEDPSALNEHSLPEDLRAQLQDLQQSVQDMEVGE